MAAGHQSRSLLVLTAPLCAILGTGVAFFAATQTRVSKDEPKNLAQTAIRLEQLPTLEKLADCERLKDHVVRVIGKPQFSMAGPLIRFDDEGLGIEDFEWPFSRTEEDRTVEIIATLRHTGAIHLTAEEEAHWRRVDRERARINFNAFKTGWFFLENATCRFVVE